MLGLAATAGLHSMVAPALLARAVRRGDFLPALVLPKVSALLTLLTVGEMVAYKTP